jgi:hypothetical protein
MFSIENRKRKTENNAFQFTSFYFEIIEKENQIRLINGVEGYRLNQLLGVSSNQQNLIEHLMHP